jgi:glycosyltransferase involved in cell wall biosynthesis
MHETSLITVLMPVRNASQYIVAAVESIRRQTEHRFRLFVIDDGSTDDGLQKVASMNDPRISIFPDRRELGIAHRLNWGIDNSDSAFIARMDADDIAEPNRLARQLAFMREHPDVAISGTWYRVFDDRTLSEPIGLPSEHEAIGALTLFASPFAHPTVMFNRTLINRDNLRYSTDFSHAEDYELWERAAGLVRLGNLPEALLRYRVHPLQVSSRHRSVQREMSDAIRRRALQRLRIAVSEEELELHCAYASRPFDGDGERMMAAKRWLRELAARVGNRHPAIVDECVRREAQLDRLISSQSRQKIWWRRLLRRRSRPTAWRRTS